MPALAAALLLVAAVPAPAQLSMARGPTGARAVIHLDTTYVEAIVRLAIARGPSAVVPALARDTVLLLPFTQFFDMAGVTVTAFALRDSAVAMLQPGNVLLRFRPTESALTRGGVEFPHDTADVVWWDGDLFIATGLLDRLLGVRTTVDWTGLTAAVGMTDGLPVVARARRERLRQLLEARHRPIPEVMDLPLHQRPLDGAVLSWSFTTLQRGPSDQTELQLGLGTGLLRGSAELRPVFWSSPAGSGGELRMSWSRAWPERRWLRQLRVGDINTFGRRAILMQGVVATNAPFLRSSLFDVEQFVGNLPPGWEVELYDRGRLLAYDAGDALGTFRVPLELRYGQNPFELVMYGPGGELVRQRRTIRVPISRLPDGRFEYAVAAGRCRYDPCDALLSADARYGVSNRVTLQGGWDAFLGGPDGPLYQPYAVVSATPVVALGVTGEAVVNGHMRLAAEYEPHMDLRVSAAHTSFARSGLPSGASTTATTSGFFFWRPSWRNATLYVQGGGALSSGPGMRRNVARIFASRPVGMARFELGLMHDQLRLQGRVVSRSLALDAGVGAVLVGPWSWLRNASAQTQVALDPGTGLTAWRASLGRSVAGGRFRLDGGFGWFRNQGLSLELSLSSSRSGPRFGARTRTTSQAGSEALLYSGGTLAFDPRSRLLRVGDQDGLGRAGIAGVLFRDDNSNGRRDDGEPGISGIPVHIDGWPAETDSAGRFSAWGVTPSEMVLVDVDSLSFDDPLLVLPAPVVRVRPNPNSFGEIEVPVVVGAEVGGYVVLGDQPIAGVPVLLRELNTGAEIRIMTFNDGGFYRRGVPPGEYEVTLPEEILDQLRALAPPLSIFVPPGTAEKRFPDLHLRLEPRE